MSSLVGGRDDVLAVAEDRRPVAQVEDLVEAVADEQDRDAAVAKPADDREQALDLVGGQRRGRLVEDEDARLDATAPWRSRSAAGRPSTGRGPARPTSNWTSSSRNSAAAARRIAPQSIDPESTGRGVADEDVLGDRQVGEQARLLVDDRDAKRAGLGRDRGSAIGSPSSRIVPLSG